MSLSPNSPQPPASPSTIASSDTDIFSRSRKTSFLNAQSPMTVLCTVLALYSLLVGISIIRGTLQWSSAHLFFVPIPLALALWYGYGFMQPAQQNDTNHTLAGQAKGAIDFGLLLQCAGWALIALALLIPPAPPRASSGTGATTGEVTSIICGVIGMLCVVAGTILSLRNWRELVRKM